MRTNTNESVEALILSEWYATGMDAYRGAMAAETLEGRERHDKGLDINLGGLERTIICMMTLVGGFVVVGVNTSSVAPELHNPQMGRELARKDAVSKIWPMVGWQLHTRIGGNQQDQLYFERERATFRLKQEIANREAAPDRERGVIQRRIDALSSYLETLQ